MSESRSVVKHKFAENAIFCKSGRKRVVWGKQDNFKWPPLLTGCGSQHPLRALGGTRVLLAAAPTTPPCFRHWRRSSSLLRIFRGKIIFISRLSRSAERSKRIFTGGGVTERGSYFPSIHRKKGLLRQMLCNSPMVLCYIFSGTLILNMVSTLKMTFFTPMHRARRACCTAGSAP